MKAIAFWKNFVKAIPLSALLFVGALAYFISLNERAVETVQGSTSTEEDMTKFIDKETAFFQCLRRNLTLDRLESHCAQTDQTTQKSGNRGQAIIYGIYFVQWACLNVQIALFFMAHRKRRELDEAYGYLSDWAINAGPMLGVIGTIVSFAFLLADAGADGLASLFNGYFFNAAITTIMGGIVYVVCLLLSVKISPAIKQ